MNLSIIIFCYNEKDNVKRVATDALQVVSEFGNASEVIIVDDGSHDGTSEIIKTLTGVKVISHSRNEGIGMALRTGYEAANGDFVCAIPGDGQFDVKELRSVKFFTPDIFISFYRPVTNYNVYRGFLSQANRFFNRYLLQIKIQDVNWVKVYRKEQLMFVDAILRSSLIETEICAKLMKAGCRVDERTSVYHARIGGIAKGGNWKTLRQVIIEMFFLLVTVKRFSKKMKISA